MAQQKSIDDIDFIQLFKSGFQKTVSLIKSGWSRLKRIHREHLLIKGLGFILFSVAGLLAFAETMTTFLVPSDVPHFVEIVNKVYTLSLLNYVSLGHLAMMIGGGYLIDMFFWALLVLLGWLLWKQQNLFALKEVLLSLLVALLVGFTFFAYGLFYALPDILIPLQSIIEQSQEMQYGYIDDFDDGAFFYYDAR